MKVRRNRDKYLVIIDGGAQFECYCGAMFWKQTLMTQKNIKQSFPSLCPVFEQKYVVESFRRWHKRNFFATKLLARRHFTKTYGLNCVLLTKGNPETFSIVTSTGISIGSFKMLNNRFGFSIQNIEIELKSVNDPHEHDTSN